MAKKIVEWVKYAIDIEKKSVSFYNECAEKSKSTAKQLFLYLKREEMSHIRALTKLLNKVSKGQAIPDVSNFRKLKNPLFASQEIDRITRSDLKGMLSKAERFEQEGIKFYTKHEKRETDKNLKRLFVRLRHDEGNHIIAIRRVGKLLGVA